MVAHNARENQTEDSGNQFVLPYTYEEEPDKAEVTALAGLPVYLDLASVVGLSRSVKKHVSIRDERGYSDAQIVTAIVLLNLSGGEHVDDLRILEADNGFCRVLRRAELSGLKRKQRREVERRWRKERKRTIPSPSAVFRYLERFDNREEEKRREVGKAFIPAANEHLQGLPKVNADLVGFQQRHAASETATLDMDATLIETFKGEATNCYKGFKSYQPLNVWWAEQGVMLYTEFRDGNVPAGHEQKRVLEEGLRYLPAGVKTVMLRSDTAGYQHELLKYCDQSDNKEVGRIEFGVSCNVSPEFKRAVAEVPDEDWQPLYKEVDGQKVSTKIEWAEVCFVPDAISHSKKGPEYRYLATRESMEQPALPGMEHQQSLPFQTIVLNKKQYKLFGLVTNMDWEGGQLVNWVHERCGKSEEAHRILKEELAGGMMPSGSFGENAAWWWMAVLAFNLNALMKKLVLKEPWVPKRLKAIRFSLINLPGRVIRHARQLIIRIAHGHPSLELLQAARLAIAALARAPAG
jgi:hypothetical protein